LLALFTNNEVTLIMDLKVILQTSRFVDLDWVMS